MKPNVGSIRRIHDNKVQPIEIADRLPVVHRCTAERIHPQVQAAGGNRLHVDHITKVLDIRRHEIISAYRRGFARDFDGYATDLGNAFAKQAVCLLLDPRCDVRVGRSPAGRVVLETAILRWIVRGCYDDSVGRVFAMRSVIHQDSSRYDGRRSESVITLNDRFHPVGGQYFKSGPLRQTRQGMRVLSHQERAVDSVGPPIVTDGLCDRQDVRFSEGPVERCAPMPARAEAYELAWIIQVRAPGVVLVFEFR